MKGGTTLKQGERSLGGVTKKTSAFKTAEGRRKRDH